MQTTASLLQATCRRRLCSYSAQWRLAASDRRESRPWSPLLICSSERYMVRSDLSVQMGRVLNGDASPELLDTWHDIKARPGLLVTT